MPTFVPTDKTPPKDESVSPNATEKQKADDAEQALRRMEAEYKIKLAEQGYKSLEDAKATLDKERDTLAKEHHQLETDKAGWGKQVAECNAKRQEAVNYYNRVKLMETSVAKRQEQAIDAERNTTKQLEESRQLLQQLQEDIAYFTENIEPIMQNLQLIRRAVYAEAERWQNNNGFINLFNYVTARMRDLDVFLDNIHNPEIPEELLPAEETTPNNFNNYRE